jgi:hypothetical protein
VLALGLAAQCYGFVAGFAYNCLMGLLVALSVNELIFLQCGSAHTLELLQDALTTNALQGVSCCTVIHQRYRFVAGCVHTF